jgi:hypothetical protein
VRKLGEFIEEAVREGDAVELFEERRELMFQLIDRQMTRAKLLARALMIFYIATGTFVATSAAIGIVSLLGSRHVWVPVLLGIAGALMLFLGSLVLIFEMRLAIRTLTAETAFLGKLATHHYRKRITEGA